jgi:hypothetical protein
MSQTETKFSNFAEIEAFIRKLQRTGYVACGKWNLSQICEHLSDWMNYPMVGFPKSGPTVSAVLFCVRCLAGKKLYRNVVSKQRMKPGRPTLPQSVYPSTLDESRSVERLVATMQALQNFSGALISSPLFGKLTHAEYVSLHIAHCAHHLSFLKTNQP